MKNISFLLVVFFISTFSSYSQDAKSVPSADEVGKYTFNVLKNFENTSEEEFVNSLMTIEEIKKFAEKVTDTTAANRLKKEASEMDPASYYKRVAEVYHDLKEKGKQYNIVWKDIKYSDFTYELREKRGIKGIEGVLVFTYKEAEYKVKTDALQDGSSYIPIIIRKLFKKDDY